MDIATNNEALPKNFCDSLIAGYSGFLEPAAVGEGNRKTYKSGRVAFSHEMKSSLTLDATTMGLVKTCDPDVDLGDLQTTHCDLVCYTPGGKFSRHRDAAKKLYTIIYFLNEGYDGGHLVFDNDKEFKFMQQGSAVCWKNTDDSHHQVTEVTSGFRFVLAHWVVAK